MFVLDPNLTVLHAMGTQHGFLAFFSALPGFEYLVSTYNIFA